MTDKEKIIDIMLEFYEEYQGNIPNRPMIPSIYASKIIDSLQEEPVSEDLNEAKRRIASEYMEEMKEKCGYKDFSYWNGLEKGIELGANWQKDQLLKDALECPLIEHPLGYVFFELNMLYPKDKYKAGDKVKIVVIKEEE